MTYACDEEKTMLEIASEMDRKLVFESTAENNGKPDTWTSQPMFEQLGPKNHSGDESWVIFGWLS